LVWAVVELPLVLLVADLAVAVAAVVVVPQV
jgi:hypothetical protein